MKIGIEKRKAKEEAKETSGHKGIEIRSEDGEGKFEGYIAVWDTVDTYNSTFIRGCFKKTIEERGDRIKVLDDHGKIIGKIDEILEDDTGCFVRGSLTMGVERARDVFEFIRSEAIDTLSFGFKAINDKYVRGVRSITEVKLYEVSPVIFEANDKAKITGFRKEDSEEGEERAVDFKDTLDDNLIYTKGWKVIDALDETLGDIWWSTGLSNDEIIAKMDEAISAFHAEYLVWANEFISRFWETRESRSMPTNDQFLLELRKVIGDKSLETIAAETTFTVDELRTLKRGGILPSVVSGKLSELSDDLGKAHAVRRRGALEDLCTELRAGGLTVAESSRLKALLEIRKVSQDENPVDELMSALEGLSY